MPIFKPNDIAMQVRRMCTCINAEGGQHIGKPWIVTKVELTSDGLAECINCFKVLPCTQLVTGGFGIFHHAALVKIDGLTDQELRELKIDIDLEQEITKVLKEETQ